MPYANEHACRLKDPGQFTDFARVNCDQKHDDKCIDVIYGIKDGKSEIQALRYKKSIWNEADAKAHCSGRGGTFEAAAKDKEGDRPMNRKLFQCKDVKLEAEGKIKLVFGTMNVIDHDGDVTLPGAIGEPQKVRMSAYNHSSWYDALPVGKGVVYESGEDMIFEGAFFLNTGAGRETYETIKSMGDLQEYSYGFDIAEAGFGQFKDQDVRFLKKLKIYEVSPVLLGAGVDTRTLDIKALSKQITDDMKKTADNADKDADSDDGADSLTYERHTKMLLDSVNEFVKRSRSIADLRKKEGKSPAAEKNHERLTDIGKALKEAADELARLTKDDDAEVAKEAALLLEQLEIREVFT